MLPPLAVTCFLKKSYETGFPVLSSQMAAGKVLLSQVFFTASAELK